MIQRWELVGVFVIFLVGSAYHFVYDWSGGWVVLAAIAPVNESVWEHLKMAIWPAIFYALVEYRVVLDRVKGFWMAKLVSICMIPVVIVVLFYLYTGIVGHHVLFVDIFIFFVAIAIGQYLSYRLIVGELFEDRLNNLGIIGLVFVVAVFAVWTFIPPELPVFLDPTTGGYGR